MAFYRDERWPAYVPVALRRRQAEKQVAALRKKGKPLDPVRVEGRGRSLARTFWGEAWCKNLESYSDYENRLPRGRTYLRNGSVIDLQVAAGSVTALVQGTELYRIAIKIRPIAAPRWKGVVRGCSGHIASLVELLRGGVSDHVMKVVTEHDSGLFPDPAEISLECSCPDWAEMCKHVAASLYGVGVRLDERPELLFTLRGVDAAELVADAAGGGALGAAAPPRGKVLGDGDLSALFGVDIDDSPAPIAPKGSIAPSARKERPASRPNPKAPRAPRARSADLGERIEAFIASHAAADMAEIAEGLGVTKNELVVPLAVLATEGRIRAERSGRATLYYPTLEMVARLRRAPPKSRGTTPGKRTAADVAAVTVRLNELIRERPGLRMEEIARALGESTMVLSLPAKKLIVAGAIGTRGQKRATRYFPR